MIHPTRIQALNENAQQNGEYALYWLQASQRVHYNLALQYAVQAANKLEQPLLVYFELMEDFPEATLRHFQFMLEGLQELEQDLSKMNCKLVINFNDKAAPSLKELAQKASLVITDREYTKYLNKKKKDYAKQLNCPLIQVEDNVVIPVAVTSQKSEYAARTIRPKIHRELNNYLSPIKHYQAKISSLDIKIKSLDLSDIGKILSQMNIDRSVGASTIFKGGTREAIKHLEEFCSNRLKKYDELRNDPVLDYQSNLSPYLHFGQISPLYIALEIMSKTSEGEATFLEELIVRRELAMNFCEYNKNYDNYECLDQWAKDSLAIHQSDPREYLYSLSQLEEAKTHDPYWNAAQDEMRITGKMHGYMRMYWGKKILEWSLSPQEAYKTALYLNNKYELDGGDPNGFAGVAWCFGKHDRPWFEREIFGKVRYMNANGLKRKFDIEKYVEKVQSLKETHSND